MGNMFGLKDEIGWLVRKAKCLLTHCPPYVYAITMYGWMNFNFFLLSLRPDDWSSDLGDLTIW